jgi:hypothetical protein
LFSIPIYANILRLSELYIENSSAHEQNLEKLIQSNQQKLSAYLGETDKLTISKENFSGRQSEKESINTDLTAIANNVTEKLNDFNNTVRDLKEYTDVLDTLTNFSERVSKNYTDKTLVTRITKTIQFMLDVYTAVYLKDNLQLNAASFSNYLTEKKDKSRYDLFKKSFPAYYELMEELEKLHNTYELDNSMILALLRIDNAPLSGKDSSLFLLK